MMSAKVANALRPSRLLLFLFASFAFGLVLAGPGDGSVLKSTATVATALVAFRLVLMAIASVLDKDARKFNGTLRLAQDGLEVVRHDGTAESHPWTWVLAARIHGRVLELQLAERRGRVWARCSIERLVERGTFEQVQAHLRAAGKLA